jgi:hypothetical protein
MKSFLFTLALIAAGAVHAQIEVDKPIELTGTGGDARVSGIQTISDAGDAVNASSVQQGTLLFATATFSSDDYSVTLTPAPSYSAGLTVHFLAPSPNTGAATLNVNGLGAVPVLKNFNAALSANDIKAGQVVSVIYDGSNFQMISQTGNAPAGAPAGTVLLISADESDTNFGKTYSLCGVGPSSGTLRTYSLAANSYSRIIVEAEGYIELGFNGGGIFNTGTVNVNLPGGISETFTARRQNQGGDTGDNGWRFPYRVSTSGAAAAGGNITVTGSLSLDGCTGGSVHLKSLRVYGVL